MKHNNFTGTDNCVCTRSIGEANIGGFFLSCFTFSVTAWRVEGQEGRELWGWLWTY
uniref:Uncharacterized protein n=1 Tax=Rhizophora mucronata TaxID=61149 RepID=A0A2P2NTH7_RHIMU